MFNLAVQSIIQSPISITSCLILLLNLQDPMFKPPFNPFPNTLVRFSEFPSLNFLLSNPMFNPQFNLEAQSSKSHV